MKDEREREEEIEGERVGEGEGDSESAAAAADARVQCCSLQSQSMLLVSLAVFLPTAAVVLTVRPRRIEPTTVLLTVPHTHTHSSLCQTKRRSLAPSRFLSLSHSLSLLAGSDAEVQAAAAAVSI